MKTAVSDGSGRIMFLGLSFSNIPTRDLIARIRVLAMASSWSYVATPNAAHLVRIFEGGEEIAKLYRSASLLILDSRFVSVISRALSLRTPTVIPGSDLTAELFRTAIDRNATVCIVGSNTISVQRLRERFQASSIHHYSPPLGFINDSAEVEKTLKFVASASANYTFLAVGSPQQEMLALLLSERGASGVGLCIGASIEFLAGGLQRAPKWMQAIGLEWLFRFMCEPRRLFRRYFIDSPKIFGILLRARLRER